MFLRTPEMKEYADSFSHLDVGGMVHVDHLDCPAGKDTKRRLYIKVVDDAVLFFCQHCGCKGVLREHGKVLRASEIEARVDRAMTLPPHEKLRYLIRKEWTSDISEWSKEARLWWHSYGLTQEEATEYNVQWDERRLWLWGAGSAWQGRAFAGDSPKYLRIDESPNIPAAFYTSEERTWVVVEDLLSAYRVHMAGYNAMCLMGTKVGHREMQVLTHAKRVVVWLDDDEAGQLGAVDLYKRLGWMCDVRNVVCRQPKEVSEAQLIAEVERA